MFTIFFYGDLTLNRMKNTKLPFIIFAYNIYNKKLTRNGIVIVKECILCHFVFT